MDSHLSDDYLDKLPNTAGYSTANSEGSLDDIGLMKSANDNLRKDLERMSEEYRLIKKIAEQQMEKDIEIEKLRLALEVITLERDDLKKKLAEVTKDQAGPKAVANPLQTALVDQLVARSVIKTKEVEAIMRSIDRGDFAAKDAYVDRPQQIGFNTTISAPHMHAAQLEILKDCFGNAKKAIDIGTGSGYVALSLAKMMKGDDFKVYALDHIPKLVDEARENVAKNHKHYIDQGKMDFILADGREGCPEHAPYDIMFVGGAVREIPEPLLEQLAPGGSMIIPVGEFYQYLMVVHKTKNGKIEMNPVMSVMFGRLQSVEDQCPDIDE